MLKKIALGSIFASVLALTYIQSTASVQDQSELTKENIEALAFFDKIEEWWNRKDYTCVSVTCECIMYDYKSEVASAVDAGTGDAAHTWNCPGCGDCGWLS